MLAAGSPSDPPVAPDYSLSNVVVTTDNEGVILPTSGAFSPRVDSHTYNLKRSTVSFTVTPTSLAEKILVDSQLVVSGNPIRIPMTMNDYPVGSGKTVFIRCTQKDVAKTYRLIFNRGAE